MTRLLLLDARARDQIQRAIEQARARPLPWQQMKEHVVDDRAKPTNTLLLSERKPGFRRPIEPVNVLIPNGYRCAISFEQQPAGLCRHLSISVDAPGQMPNVPAVEMIAKAFGFTLAEGLKVPVGRAWVEEFEPGQYAINIVQVAEGGA